MIATGQGPTPAPVTAGGKLFAALMAFLSVGVVGGLAGVPVWPLLRAALEDWPRAVGTGGPLGKPVRAGLINLL